LRDVCDALGLLAPAQPLALELFELAQQIRIEIDRRCGLVRFARLFGFLGDGFDRTAFRTLGQIRLARRVGFGFACDVETPAGQARGEPHVLAFASDRKRELVVGNDDQRRAVVFEELDADDFGGPSAFVMKVA